jgi:putative sigma-54 modulation protein
MNTEIKGIHLEVNDHIKGYIDKKMPRLEFAKDLIVDFLMSLSKEKSQYKLEATINFRWASSVHVHADGFDLYQAIDALFDKLEAKIVKEKSKIKEHHKKEAARTTEE